MRQQWIPGGSSVPAPSARCSRWSGARRRPTWPRSSTATGWWPGTGAGSPRTSPRCFPIPRSTSWSSRTAPSSTGSPAGATSVGWRARDGASGRSSCPAGSPRSPQLRSPSSPTALCPWPTCSVTRPGALEDAIDTDALLQALYGLLRARLPAEPDPRIALVGELVADIRAAPPDGSVADLAARHHVSVRTVQRLFSQYVGVGPKWVMQRYRLHDARRSGSTGAGATTGRGSRSTSATTTTLTSCGTSARWWAAPPPSTSRRRCRDKPGSKLAE